MEIYNERKIKKLRIIRNLIAMILIIEIIVIVCMIILIRNDSQMEPLISQEIEAYNSKFCDYEGIIEGYKAKELCNIIRKHNKEEVYSLVSIKEGRIDKEVKLLTENDDLSLTTQEHIEGIEEKIELDKMYNIMLGYDPYSSIVTAIGIEEIIK